MKRIIFFLFTTIFVVCGGLILILTSDTPEKVLHDGLTKLIEMKSAGTMKLDVSWTSEKTKSTTGFTYTGAVDIQNILSPNISGVVRIGANTTGLEDQTGDIVAVQEYIAVRPRSVGPEWRAKYEKLAGVSTTKPYVRFERSTFFEALGYEQATTESTNEDIRKALAFIYPLAIPQGPLLEAKSSIGPLKIVNFKIDRSGVNAFMYNMLKTWHGRAPTAEELGTIDRVFQAAATATFRIAITKDTRIPVELQGDFPYVDSFGKLTPLTVHFTLGLQGLNQMQDILMPPSSIDAAIGLKGAQASITLPSAHVSTSTAFQLQNSETQQTFGQIVNEARIDVYEKYLDTLKKKNTTSKSRK